MGENSLSRAHGARHTPEQITPKDLKVMRAEQELRITWRDGTESIYPAIELRKQCPCASCRTEREKQSGELLPVLKQPPAESVTLVNAQLVGTYAIQLFWSDGHSTGLYDYRFLRDLDEYAEK